MSESVLKKRKEISDCYKWKMSDVYKNKDAWQEDVEAGKQLLNKIPEYQGKLCSNISEFKASLELINKIELLVSKVYFYANQLYHEDLGNSEHQAMTQTAAELLNDFYTATAFVETEFIQSEESVIKGYLQSDDELKQYSHYFDDLFRQKKHIISQKEEEILAKVQRFSDTSNEIFQVFNNADLKFPIIKDENGDNIRLTHGRLNVLLESNDRRVRKDTFTALYDTYSLYRNTLASIYIGSLKKDSFYADVRKYDSSREMHLSDSNIPVAVYDNLIKAVNDNIHLLHRYVELRKKVLNLDELHLYDMYAPLVSDITEDISYAEAKRMVIDGLSPMGEDYITLLNKGFEDGWIDVYENEGKKSGAYSWSVYGTHPYVLLNYQPNLNSVFTIAHEMGHAIHSYYSNSSQTFSNAEYKIFVAEVASTCNESLLIHHLINKCEDKKKKAYLINHFLEQFRGTLFRQTMFAEFENIVHKLVDEGEPLNCDKLCSIYYELNRKYFGDEMVVDKSIEMEWARIPHFYSAFYVYQYATGFSAAIALSQRILNCGESAVEDYKKFLKGGCSDYPIELLKIAGVDMGSDKPVYSAMKVFEELLNEFENLI